jgi:hypothetical protein
MNKEYKYRLANRDYKHKKVDCPKCGEKGRFVPEMDTTTGQPVDLTIYGRCDREVECGYERYYRTYLKEQGITSDKKVPYKPRKEPKNEPQPELSYVPMDKFNKTLNKGHYQSNRLIQFLYGVFGVEVTDRAMQQYHVGTCSHWDGATVFWEVDLQGKVRAGKVMQYDSTKGKRVEDPKTGKKLISSAHYLLKLPDPRPSQCFFGEHLLVDTTKTVAIVESEKTAVIASIDDPDMIWLACGSLTGLSTDKCQILKGRNVILYPDASDKKDASNKKINCFDYWNEVKTERLESICDTVVVSDLIENEATKEEKTAGYDYADYLLKIIAQEKAERERSEQVARVQDQEQVQAPTIDVQDSAIDVQEYQLPSFPIAYAISSDSAIDVQEYQPAYVGNDGTLYIPTPPDRRTTYTVRESVDAYNQRKGTISFIPMQNMDTSGMKQVFINLKTLTI